MNCTRCDYLLWDLPENRCPECAQRFEATDYAFEPGAVEFLCRNCGQEYEGVGDLGLPRPERFDCVGCGAPLDAATMGVHPARDDAQGVHRSKGAPWQHRRGLSAVRGYVDAVARLSLNPSEFFRRIDGCRQDGAVAFSVMCAYVATAIVLLVTWILQASGIIGGGVWPTAVRPRVLLLILAAIPLIQIAWVFVYGMCIQAMLRGFGHSRCDFDASIRVVALGSAVLPAALIFPPLGLIWYLGVICCGIRQLQHTSAWRAIGAAVIPMLFAVNLVLAVWYLAT